MRGRAAADCSKVRHGPGNQESGFTNSRIDALEQASSPPQGPEAPQGLRPPRPSLVLLPAPGSAELQLLTPAKPQRQALAFPTALPQLGSIPLVPASDPGASRTTAPTQTHRPPASSEGGHGGAHLPPIKPEALSSFDTLQACCMSKQICLRSVRPPVCLHPGVKEPRTCNKGAVGEATDWDLSSPPCFATSASFPLQGTHGWAGPGA